MSNDNFDIAVCIGRFQLLHHGQLAMLRRALEIAPRVVVVLGSAFQARSPRNPFDWEECVRMIQLALPEEAQSRIRFVPMRDYYDTRRWVKEVVKAVDAPHGARVALVGHRKDATSTYLNDFPAWTLVDIGSQGDLHAKALRAAFFAGDDVEASLAAIGQQVPASTVSFLRAWAQLPFLPELREEWRALVGEKEKWKSAPYTPIFTTVDAVVHTGNQVLLIRRGRSPGKGRLALPGGFLEERETVYQSAVRELEEETGFSLIPSDLRAALQDVRVFDHPDRSQRGRVITHAHYFKLSGKPQEVHAADDAAEAKWVAIDSLAGLEAEFHDDHFHILDVFLGVTAGG